MSICLSPDLHPNKKIHTPVNRKLIKDDMNIKTTPLGEKRTCCNDNINEAAIVRYTTGNRVSFR